MNCCELLVSANASRLKPGEKVPLAAPSCAVVVASFASCCNDLPWADGNWLAAGWTAADRSLTAGAGFVVAVVVGWLEGVELVFDDAPHAASANARPTIARRRGTTG